MSNLKTLEQDLCKIVLARRADEDSTICEASCQGTSTAEQIRRPACTAPFPWRGRSSGPVRQGGTTLLGQFCVSHIEKEDCRLILQAGIAAAHHGLLNDAQIILDALPVLVSDHVQQCLLRSVLLFSLQRRQEAQKCLVGLDCDEAEQLKALFLASEECYTSPTIAPHYYAN